MAAVGYLIVEVGLHRQSYNNSLPHTGRSVTSGPGRSGAVPNSEMLLNLKYYQISSYMQAEKWIGILRRFGILDIIMC